MWCSDEQDDRTVRGTISSRWTADSTATQSRSITRRFPGCTSRAASTSPRSSMPFPRSGLFSMLCSRRGPSSPRCSVTCWLLPTPSGSASSASTRSTASTVRTVGWESKSGIDTKRSSSRGCTSWWRIGSCNVALRIASFCKYLNLKVQQACQSQTFIIVCSQILFYFCTSSPDPQLPLVPHLKFLSLMEYPGRGPPPFHIFFVIFFLLFRSVLSHPPIRLVF